MAINIGQALRQSAIRHPDRYGLVDVGQQGSERVERTYAQLDLGACRVAHKLRQCGLRPGARVALMAKNGRSFIEAWFGIVYAGCTVVPVPILSAAPELAFRLGHARCEALIVDLERRRTAEKAVGSVDRYLRLLDEKELTQGGDPDPEPFPWDTPPDAPAMVLYTSGTTGKPKGAVITHASLMAHTAGLVHHTLKLSGTDRVMGVLPLTHSYGIRMVVLAPFYAGARCVLVPRFRPKRVLDLLRDEEISWFPAVPTMLTAISHEQPAKTPIALRWCLSAGAPLPEDVRVRAEQRLKTSVRQGYGLTEATFSTIDAPPAPETPGSVGRPVWGIEVRIVDSTGRPAMRTEEGEIEVRGQNVMAGYLDDPEATKKVLDGGWLSTGDIGVLDEEGKLTIVDRIKDLVIRGGNNVYPSEVEGVLASHPGVADVAVIGRPDDYYGEEVVAVIVPRTDPPVSHEDLDGWARERLALTKVPRELVFLERLPLGPSGKVLKRELRARIVCGDLSPVPIVPRSEH